MRRSCGPLEVRAARGSSTLGDRPHLNVPTPERAVLAMYLFCLVFGGGFLLVSLLGAGDSGDLELDVDLDADLELEAHHDTAASKIFSLRTLVYAIFGFGATGAALTALGFGALPGLGLATLGGAASGTIVTALFGYVGRTSSGDPPSDAALIGLTGRVTLPLTANVPGTVVVERGGRRVSLRALPYGGESAPEQWTAVVVVEIDRGVARVAPLTGGDAHLLPGAPD